jgi:hypothetical protein
VLCSRISTEPNEFGLDCFQVPIPGLSNGSGDDVIRRRAAQLGAGRSLPPGVQGQEKAAIAEERQGYEWAAIYFFCRYQGAKVRWPEIAEQHLLHHPDLLLNITGTAAERARQRAKLKRNLENQIRTI